MESREIKMEIDDLKKEYRDFQFHIPSFQAYGGEYIGIIGENGAGKSTWLHLILQLAKKDGGMIRLLGEEERTESIKAKVGVVYENCCFSGEMTIPDIDRVMKSIYRKNWDSALFFDEMNKNDLPMNKKIAEWSLGMKTKLNIYAALCHNPEIILVDEATGSLDPVVRKEIHKTIRDFVDRTNAVVLLSSHIVNELEQYCNRLVFLSDGKIAFDLTPKELREEFYMVRTQKDVSAYDHSLMVLVEGNEKCFTRECITGKKVYKACIIYARITLFRLGNIYYN